MPTITFDTLAYSNRLQKGGFTREQAEAMAETNSNAFGDMVNARDLATKQDLALARNELEIALAETKSDLEKKLAETKSDLEKKLAETKSDLEKKLAETKSDLELSIAQVKHDLEISLAKTSMKIVTWVVSAIVAQTALVVAILAYWRQ